MSRDLRETKEPPGKNISQGRNVRKFLTWKNAGISSEKKDGQDGWSIVSRRHICVSSLSSSFVFSFFFFQSVFGFLQIQVLKHYPHACPQSTPHPHLQGKIQF